MMRALRNVFLLAVSAVVSYLLFLHRPREAPAPAEAPPPPAVDLAVAPRTEPEPPPPEPEPEPEPQPAPPAPPPPETGTPEGEPDAEIKKELEALRGERELVERATAEVTGETRRGFQTVFLCAPRDQEAIARAFDEPLVLVPRAGLDPRKPHYFRYRPGHGVERVDAPAPLESFRQYRNLFRFPYDDLPPPLRALRRSVPNRGDVYLFAALIPPAEWAVVMARREAALAAHGGRRTLDDLRRVTMRYVPLRGGGFDIRVAELVFHDGSRWTPES